MPDTPDIPTFNQLKQAARRICEYQGVPAQAYAIIREIERGEIVAIAKRRMNDTGGKLTQSIKSDLAEQFGYSEKAVEMMIYRAT